MTTDEARWRRQAVSVLRAVLDWDRYLTREEEPVLDAAMALLVEIDGDLDQGAPICHTPGCRHEARHDADESDDDAPTRCWWHAHDRSRVVS